MGDKELQKFMMEEDKSFNNLFAHALFDSTINVLLKQEIEQIKMDSANSVGKYPVDTKAWREGKTVTSHCLRFYNSERLARAAKKEKRRWNRIPNIMDEISRKVPSY